VRTARALHAGARESRFQAFRELGLADAGKAGHVHRNACLQADGDQLDELGELHVVVINGVGYGPRDGSGPGHPFRG
jgi:hypothetical protein